MKVKPTPKPGRVVVEIDRQDEPLLTRSAPAGGGEPGLFRVQKILVPIDFSACSIKALQYAVPFARQFGAALTLLHVMPVNYFVGSEFGPVDFPLPEAELREASERELVALAAREIGAAVPVQTRVGRGQPMHEIVRVARELEMDLILLSTHGHTGLRHVLLGSVAENVVRYAPCPVLVVREHEHEFVNPPAASRKGSTGYESGD
jgi:nucleotide-binding universal stress UspA family protein